jgi:hypothetical protein
MEAQRDQEVSQGTQANPKQDDLRAEHVRGRYLLLAALIGATGVWVVRYVFPDKSSPAAVPTSNPAKPSIPTPKEQGQAQEARPKPSPIDSREFPLEFSRLECINEPTVLGKLDLSPSDVVRRDTFDISISNNRDTVTVEKIQFCVRTVHESTFNLKPGVDSAGKRHTNKYENAVFEKAPREGDCITLCDAFTCHSGTTRLMAFQFYWLEHVYDRMPEAKNKLFNVWGNFVIVLADGRKLKSHREYMVLAP